SYAPFAILMNDKIAPFNNPDVRKAISLGLNRAAVNAGLNGLCTPTDQFVPEGVPGHDSSLKIQENLTKAKDLINKAGANGASFPVPELAVEPHMTISRILQAQLAQLGLNAKFNLVPGTIARATFRSATDPALIITALPPFVDGASYLDDYAFGIDNP